MIVLLKHAARVLLPAGLEIEVPEQEGRRLLAFGQAVKVEAQKAPEKAPEEPKAAEAENNTPKAETAETEAGKPAKKATKKATNKK